MSRLADQIGVEKAGHASTFSLIAPRAATVIATIRDTRPAERRRRTPVLVAVEFGRAAMIVVVVMVLAVQVASAMVAAVRANRVLPTSVSVADERRNRSIIIVRE